ncbi:signal peptide peptidase SppA [Robertmurraya yapensis]|uniref:Signal peptide peptidase SppA n=1 Tax=Bacillus yapensis TaxID=2492960 RepID=A0A3S0RJ54_9BACI|nr:signal peptide peptidase SppA [Bacillus yapensis]RTR29596.1 signal peptide peptidase SppA [Bacillus yapensis]TKS94942.1 signal peptide peptidase SppA [Bacillus yapensis]
MTGKRWAALGIAAVLLFFSIAVNTFSIFAFSDLEKSFDEMFGATDELFMEEVIEEGDAFNRIAVLDINGTIQDTGNVTSLFASEGYNHRTFMEKLEQVKEDDTVKAVVIRVNTPGGGVVESAEIHDKIVEIQTEAKKPVYISMGSMAASGGYYVSAPAHKIFASPETLTGSLGVIMQGYNFAGLAEKYGVEFVTIKSGPYKDIMSATRDMTEEEKGILQSMISNSYEGFVDVIAEGRDMTEEQVKKIADGRIYDGRQAKELGLIDDFGYFEDVVEAVKKEQKISDAQVVSYTENFGIGSFLSMGAQKFMGGDQEISSLINILSQTHSPRLMYMYAE